MEKNCKSLRSQEPVLGRREGESGQAGEGCRVAAAATGAAMCLCVCVRREPGWDLRPRPRCECPGVRVCLRGERGRRRLSALLSRSLSLNVIYVRGALAASP